MADCRMIPGPKSPLCVSDVSAVTGIMSKFSMQHHGTDNTSFMILLANIPNSSSPLKLSKMVIKIMKPSGWRQFCIDRKMKGNVP